MMVLKSTSYDDATLNESYEYDNGANAKGKLTKITYATLYPSD